MPDDLRFTIDAPDEHPGALDALVREVGLEPDARHTERRTVLDTFDWRVWRRGYVLEHVEPTRGRAAGRPRLVQRDRATGAVVASAPSADLPRTADALPDGPIADGLAGAVGIRALLALAVVDVDVDVHRALDDERKTVARLGVTTARPGDGPPLPATVTVRPVRGYQRAARRLARAVAERPGLVPGAPDVAEAALRRAGLDPGGYSSKLRLDLDPRADAGQAWHDVLTSLADTLAHNERGTIDDVDSEFLHDFRVAVRRTRSVLAQGRGVLDPAGRDRFRDEFRWLGGVTSPLRDLDVWLLSLPALAAGIDPSLGCELGPLRDLLVRHQRREQRALRRVLSGDRYHRVVTDYRAWLEAGPPDASSAPDVSRSAAEVAGTRIAKAFRRVERDGRRIDDASPAEALHELRKDAKRLRYALECFGSLFPREHVAPLVKDLKALQDVLGAFQDGEVQTTTLRHHADELAASGADSAALLAMGALIEQLAEHQVDARAAFAQRFARFDTRANRRTVRDVFAAAPAGGPSR